MIRVLIFVLLLKYNLCENINNFFEKVNEDKTKFNGIAAEIAWNSAVGATVERESESYQLKNILWHRNLCKKIATLHNNHLLNATQERQAYLLCRGPKFSYYEARDFTNTFDKMRNIYNQINICIPKIDKYLRSMSFTEEAILNYISSIKLFLNLEGDPIFIAVKLAANFDKEGICLAGEKNFEKMMEFSRNEDVLKWVWLSWREKLRSIGEPFKKMVMIENNAAKRNGYNDIGAYWRDETEVQNLRQFVHELLENARPLYEVLHAVIRFYLRKTYGDIVPENGLIPTHLLGNLWSQNWEPLADLIMPQVIDIDERIRKLNWTVKYMVERTEDFYLSMGLPPMSDAFWRRSIFTRQNDSTSCFGSAADMYNGDDVRISYCSGTNFQDFRVLHHEFGHLQYFMAYKNQPGIFRQANTALHESIGDAVMYGVMTPQHLHRLRLITDAELYKTSDPIKELDIANKLSEILIYKYVNDKNNARSEDDINEIREKLTKQYQANTDDENDEIDDMNVDYMILLKQALNELPQISYSLLIEEYRWQYFEGSINEEALNKEYWKKAEKFMGVAPPIERGEDYFDIGAELHVADNTPHIRYFLSSFLQHQIFEHLCKTAVFGHKNSKNDLPDTIPLTRCDIYGSKAAGKVLKDFMSRGNSQHWQIILNETIGEENISAAALLRYYRPLQQLLLRLVKKYQIPIGW